jgi:sigma-B regulation protein RsbU (phosphoserine phosphatase)
MAETVNLPSDQTALAAEIQDQLLPRMLPTPQGIQFGAYYRPSSFIGSDYYDFIEIDSDHLGVAVADVSTPGLAGALVMAQVRTMLRASASENLSPRECMIRLNRLLASTLPKGMFVTLFYVVVDLPQSILTLCSAGHPGMLFWHRKMDLFDQVNTNGLALGIDAGPVFERSISEMSILFEPGDRFLLYTNGLTGARNPEGQPFGVELLSEAFLQAGDVDPADSVGKIMAAAQAFQQTDDITLVSARCLEAPRQRSIRRSLMQSLRRFPVRHLLGYFKPRI